MKHHTDGRSLFLNLKSVRASKVAMVVVVALIVGIPFSVSAHDEPDDRASAELRPLNFLVNFSVVTGEVKFRGNGSELSVEGEAEGMDPDTFYFSLLYDINSVATGDFACEPGFVGPADLAPAGHPGALTLEEMGLILPDNFLLVWDVSDDGDGELSGTVPGVHLDRVRTISIRTGPGPTLVVACGLIVADD